MAGIIRGGMRRQDALYVLIRGVRHAAVWHEIHGAVALGADGGHCAAGQHVAVVVCDRHWWVATLHLGQSVGVDRTRDIVAAAGPAATTATTATATATRNTQHARVR